MKNTELFDILVNIDDKFYDEALGGDSERPVKIAVKSSAFSIRNVILPAAACLAVAAGIGASAHFLNRDVIDPNPANSNTLSNVVLENPDITEADLEQCRELAQKHADKDFDFDGSVKIADIDSDGVNEAVVAAQPSKLVIYDKTPKGMIETAVIDHDGYVYGADELFEYEADGERYYYFKFYRYDLGGVQVSAAARIRFDEGVYGIDYPLAYGFYRDDPNRWFFMTDCADVSEFSEDPVSNISAEEFKEKWQKHAWLPEFEYYASFDEEYPLLSETEVPAVESAFVSADMLHGAVLSVRELGGYKLCLVGNNIFRLKDDGENTLRAGSVGLALVKDGEKLSSDVVHGFISSVTDGFSSFVLDMERLDKYIGNIFTLDDGASIIEFRYKRADSESFGAENAFFAVKEDSLVQLFSGGYDVGELGVLTRDGNTLIDSENGVRFTFYPDAFEGNPYDSPHFTKSVYLPEGDYPAYNGQAASRVTLCEKKLGVNNKTVKLLALDAEPVTIDGVECVKFSQLILSAEDGTETGGRSKQIDFNGADRFIASRLDDYLVTIEFSNTEHNELIAVYQSLDEGSAIREYAVFYDASNGNVFHQKLGEHSGAPIVSGDPCFLGTDFKVYDAGDDSCYVSVDNGGSMLIFDFEIAQYNYIQQ